MAVKSLEASCEWLLKEVHFVSLSGLFILPNQFNFHSKYLEKIYFLQLGKNLYHIAYQRKMSIVAFKDFAFLKVKMVTVMVFLF